MESFLLPAPDAVTAFWGTKVISGLKNGASSNHPLGR